MTKGTPYKLLLKFAVPLFIGNVFQQFYNLVDSIVVGNYVSSNALGAIGTTNSLVFFFFSLMGGLSVGIGIIISQHFGAGNKDKVKETIGTGISVIFVASLVVFALGFFLARPVLTLMQTDPKILDDAVLYLRMISLGALGMGFYNGTSSVLRALGDSKSPLIFLIISCIMNVVLDLLFVLVIPMGVFGVALGTVISHYISALLCIVYARKTNSYFKISKNHLKPNSATVKKTLRLGVPVALQNSMIAFSLIVLQGIVNSYGAVFTTAFTIVGRIESLVQQPFISLGAAMASYTGQNIGAGRYDRVQRGFKSANIMNFIFAAVIIFVFWVFTEPIVSMFGKDAQTLKYAVDGLRITSAFYFFLGMIYPTRNVMNGAGDAAFSVYTGIVECIGRILFTYPLTLIPF
ncbi:MAG: MATE family efflux transporter, partial [Eubacterium sp.]|nr:MATE family efflux transporter [Eubacterium sp.]